MWLTLSPAFDNSVTIEKLGNTCAHDSNNLKLNRNKSIKSTKFKNQNYFWHWCQSLKNSEQLLTNKCFFHKIKGNTGRKINITREKTFSLDLCYFLCDKNLLSFYGSVRSSLVKPFSKSMGKWHRAYRSQYNENLFWRAASETCRK